MAESLLLRGLAFLGRQIPSRARILVSDERIYPGWFEQKKKKDLTKDIRWLEAFQDPILEARGPGK